MTLSFVTRILFLSPLVYRLLRIGTGILFIWAGGVKLMDPRAFARALSGYGLLPDALLVPVAIGLPVVEVLAGVGLVLDLRGSLKVISGLLLMFLAVLGYGMLNNLNVDCGCFSTEEVAVQNSLHKAFLRDLGLLLVMLYLFLWQRVQRQTCP
jgi:uncharacterized membrane protein YphA (DoxX/SURF4 family)